MIILSLPSRHVQFAGSIIIITDIIILLEASVLRLTCSIAFIIIIILPVLIL